MPTPPPRPDFEPPSTHRCERVAMPRKDQGVVNSLGHAYGVEALPEDLRALLARLR